MSASHSNTAGQGWFLKLNLTRLSLSGRTLSSSGLGGLGGSSGRLTFLGPSSFLASPGFCSPGLPWSGGRLTLGRLLRHLPPHPLLHLPQLLRRHSRGQGAGLGFHHGALLRHGDPIRWRHHAQRHENYQDGSQGPPKKESIGLGHRYCPFARFRRIICPPVEYSPNGDYPTPESQKQPKSGRFFEGAGGMTRADNTERATP